MRLRLRILTAFFFLAFLAVSGRLFFWQVIKGGELSQQARAQQVSGARVVGNRGDILASDGSSLAASSDSWLMFVTVPEVTGDVRAAANDLARLLVDPEAENYDDLLLEEAIRIENLMVKNDLVWVPIAKKINSETKRLIEGLEIGGIGFELEEKRIYPEASASAHVLGFVGKDDEGDDRGYFGLEGYYDLTMTGKQGVVEREQDALGIPILFGTERDIAALGGVNLKTHIDKTIQLALERKLKSGIDIYGAKSGTVIVMNPKDGAVMAMASFPSYDPLNYHEYSDVFFRNPGISDSFEPGSVLKPIVMAAGLDSEVVDPDTSCDICDGPLKVDKFSIETWNNEYNAGSSMIDVIKNSDNVGMAFVGQKLGDERLHEYFEKFGLGELTGVDLQGEASPSLRPKETWNIVDLATASFGQGVAVTPIQMISAVAAIANDGVRMTPQVVDKLVLGDWEHDIEPQEAERAISKKAAKQITDMMVTAVRDGEAKWAVPDGFRIAGKTGTAQIPVAGHYDAEKTIASFVGFAPANDPKFVMLVSLQEPQSSPWASETAAPLWFGIALELFPYLGVQPEN